MRALGLLLAAFFGATGVWGDEPALVTDRPDQCDTPFIVPKGLFQVEGGAAYGERDEAGEKLALTTIPGALLRFGATDTFELRLGIPGYSWQSTDTATGAVDTDGLADFTLGFKVKLAEQRGAVPHAAFVGTLVVPSGADAFSSGRVDPGFRFAFSNTLADSVALTYDVGLFWLTQRDASGAEDTRSFYDWAITASFATGPRLGVFTELFGVAGASDPGQPATSTGAGVTYLVTPRIQVDGRVTVGLSRAALDWNAGVGVSWRFPRHEG